MYDEFDNSVTVWIEELKRNSPEAAGKFWNRYFDRLVPHARRKLGDVPRRTAPRSSLRYPPNRTLTRLSYGGSGILIIYGIGSARGNDER